MSDNASEPTKILFVDDEPDVEVLMKQRFRREVRKGHLELFFAQNGLLALEVLGKEPEVRMVISDINMPEMDGLTLLGEINDKFPMVIPVIVSAYGDMSNIRSAMNLGAFDFVTKPINFDDLTKTIEKTQKHIQYLLDSSQTKSRLTGILQELDVASNIQQSILPKNFVNSDTFKIYALMQAARQIGGDFYDFFPLPGNRMGIVMADVSGKGVPAALFMTVSRTMLRTFALQASSPAEVMANTNNALCAENVNVMFVTTFYGILDMNTGVFEYANGGHNPPFVLKKDGAVEMFERPTGMALGILESEATDYQEGKKTLASGDRIFLYTDGVTEAEKANGDQLGDQATQKLLETHHGLEAEALVKAMRTDIEAFADGHPQSDDITMLLFEYRKA